MDSKQKCRICGCAWFNACEGDSQSSGFNDCAKIVTDGVGLTEFATEVHNVAFSHGWWENNPSLPEIIALCHSELSEALEEYRNGRDNIYFSCGGECNCGDYSPCKSSEHDDTCPWNDNAPTKPEGIAIELADCILRILDFCGHAEIDIEQALLLKHKYNKTRPHRHGEKNF